MQHALDTARFDKIRPVRDAVMEALIVHRKNNIAKPIEVRMGGKPLNQDIFLKIIPWTACNLAQFKTAG